MEWIGEFFSFVLSLFQSPLSLYGYTFSFWQMFWWTLVAGLLLWLIVRIFS